MTSEKLKKDSVDLRKSCQRQQQEIEDLNSKLRNAHIRIEHLSKDNKDLMAQLNVMAENECHSTFTEVSRGGQTCVSVGTVESQQGGAHAERE